MPVPTAARPALPFHLRFAVALGLSPASRPAVLCELVAHALVSGLWDADDLDAGLDAALDAGDFGPLAAALSRIYGPEA